MLQGRNILTSSLYFLLACAVLCTASTHAIMGPEKPDELIRVKIGQYYQFEMNGYDLSINSRARLADNRKLAVQCVKTRNREEVQLGTIGRYSSPLVLEANGGYIFINGNPYRGRVIVHYRDDQCLVVNEIGVEKYIAGVINNEMQANWPLEALKAQAITARSYAIYEIYHSTNPYYHVESNTNDQMYGGASTESERSNLATRSTRGIVLYYETDVLKAYYHSDCGGRTDVPESVWGTKQKYPYKSVSCPYHFGREPRSMWGWKIGKHQLEAALRKTEGIIPGTFLRLASLSSGVLTQGYRSKNIVVTDSVGSQVTIPANLFRQSLGYNRIKSAKFDVIAHDDSLEFRGRGYGHGVGMCQYGAREMALQGKSHLGILKHYYPLARLANLY